MKKLLAFTLLLILAVTMFAQNDVTQFLGISVDGTKSEMIRKLKAKGFTPSRFDNETLTGEFNGTDVVVSVVTDNNKVYRIFVMDTNTISGEQIKLRFNKLCKQFYNNAKYLRLGNLEDFTIPEDEDIQLNFILNKKTYQADFYQLPDTIACQNHLREELLKKYTEAELGNPTEQIMSDANAIIYEYLEMRRVWFCISKDSYDEYRISMYYDNMYNRANGEDL